MKPRIGRSRVFRLRAAPVYADRRYRTVSAVQLDIVRVTIQVARRHSRRPGGAVGRRAPPFTRSHRGWAYRTGALTGSRVRRLFGLTRAFRCTLLKGTTSRCAHGGRPRGTICARNGSSGFGLADDRRGRQRQVLVRVSPMNSPPPALRHRAGARDSSGRTLRIGGSPGARNRMRVIGVPGMSPANRSTRISPESWAHERRLRARSLRVG